ncbi:MAG TPA: type II toxin-antitoxin system Phd/YefM family antitoxin [Vicinamibacterales bacterium]|nr:type II toxin-antitoxin system Phd/YefM family antitoxin [Vicinamibacterales bacterium]
MSTVTVAEAKRQFSELLRRAEYTRERVLVRRHGKPVAAIVSTEDLRRLEAMDDETDVADARLAMKEAARQGTASLDSVLRKHGLEYLLVPEKVVKAVVTTAKRTTKPAPAKKQARATRKGTSR